MMQHYTLVITRRAEQDLDQAIFWYSQASSEISAKWREEMLLHMASLESNPARCPMAHEESAATQKHIRQLLHGSRHGQYRIFFEIDGTRVVVHSIIHSSRQRGI